MESLEDRVLLATDLDYSLQTGETLEMVPGGVSAEKMLIRVVNETQTTAVEDYLFGWQTTLMIVPEAGAEGTLRFNSFERPLDYVFDGRPTFGFDLGSISPSGDTLIALDTILDTPPGEPVTAAPGVGLVEIDFLAQANTSGVFGIHAVPNTEWVDSSTPTVQSHFFANVGAGGAKIGEVEVGFPSGLADLGIQKTASTGTVFAGEPVTYTVTVTNNGPDEAQNVVVTDTLPVGTTYISDSDNCVPGPPGTLNCPLGDLAAGNTTSFDIEVMVDSDTPQGTITNTATVVADAQDNSPANNTADALTDVETSADLGILKSDNPDTVKPGDPLTYTVTVTNDGPSDAKNVVVTDTLPLGVTYVSDTDNCVEGPTGTLKCSLGDVAAGASTSFDILVLVDTNTPEGTITNLASVASDTADNILTNNSAVEDTNVDADGSYTLEAGGPVVMDPGTVSATEMLVRVVNPGGPTDPGAYVSAWQTMLEIVPRDNAQGTVRFNSLDKPSDYIFDGHFAFSFGLSQISPSGLQLIALDSIFARNPGAPVPPGPGENLVEFDFIATADARGTFDVVAVPTTAWTDSGTPIRQTHFFANVGEGPTPIGQIIVDGSTVADLEIQNTASPEPVIAGNELTYTVDVTNHGPDDALNVVVTHTLPVDVTYVSNTDSCVLGPGSTLTCPLGNLPAGASTSFDIATTVHSDAPEAIITSTSTVNSDMVDDNPANNAATAVTNVVASADLQIEKSDLLDPVIAGSPLTYSVQVTNNGPSDAQNVVVTDTLPAGVTYVSDTAGCVHAPAGTLTCSLGDLAAGASLTFQITSAVNPDTPEGTIVNTATVSSSTPDHDPSNDTATETTDVLAISSDPLYALTTNSPLTMRPGDVSDDNMQVRVVNQSGPTTEESFLSGWQTTILVAPHPGAEGTLQFNDFNLASDYLLDGRTTFGFSQTKISPSGDQLTAFDAVIDGLPGEPVPSDPGAGLFEFNFFASADARGTFGIFAIPFTEWTDSSTPFPQAHDFSNIGTDIVEIGQVEIAPLADLEIQKTSTPEGVVAGESLTYTVTVTNNGPNEAENVVVTDVLPVGVTHVSNTDSCVEAPAGTLTCSLGDLAAGATASFDIQVDVALELPTGEITNTATVDSDTDDDILANNTATAVTAVQAAGVAYTLHTGDPLILDPDAVSDKMVLRVVDSSDSTDPVEYLSSWETTLVIVPSGGAQGSLWFNSLNKPANYLFDGLLAFSFGLSNISPSGETLTALDAILAPLPGADVPTDPGAGLVEFDFLASADAHGVFAIVAIPTTKWVDSARPVKEPHFFANVGAGPTEVGQVIVGSPELADLRIEKTDAPDPIIAGDTLVYTITVANDGPSDAQNVVVTDTLPAGVAYVSDTGGCVEGPVGTLTCALGNLSVGATTSFDIEVLVPADTPAGAMINTATVASDTPEANVANNTVTEATVVQQLADLGIEKNDLPDPINAGDSLVYTITVTNDGPSDAEDVVVTDTLPAGVAYVSDTDACVEGPAGTLTCALGDLAAGATTAFAIEVTVLPDTPAGTITNTATVTADTADANPDNNTAIEETVVQTQADLAIEKSDAVDPVVAGGTLIYTVTVTNDGPSDAQNVVVTDTLPTGVAYVSDTDACVEGPAGTLTCTLGNLAAGATTSFDIEVAVLPDTPVGTITNVATVTADTVDDNPDNNIATEETSVQTEADLAIEKNDSDDPVIAGGTLIYTVTVTNDGPGDAQNVVVTDTLPAGVAYVSDTDACVEGPAGTLTCTLGNLAAGATTSFDIEVTVLPDTPAGTITNAATVTADTADANPDNNTATEETVVQTQADLAIDKSDAADPVVAGGTLIYTVTVTNDGPSDAQNVVVTDTLPAGVAYVSDTDACVEGPAGTLTCTLGNLAAGATTSFDIEVVVLPDTPVGTITNVATVTADTVDGNPDNNTATEETSVQTEADLAIEKNDSDDPVIAGGTLIYTVTVTNDGPGDAQNVVVTDTLPAGVAYVSDTDTCVEGPAGTLTCTLGNLTVGATTSFDIEVTVLPDTPAGTITNTATVTADTADANPDNSTATEETEVQTQADLAIDKSDSADPIVAGNTLVYTVTVANDGPSDAQNVVVTDTLPASVAYASDTGGCVEGPVGTLTCGLGSLAAGATTSFDIEVTVPVDTPAGTIVNTATVNADTPDDNAANNTATEETEVEASGPPPIHTIERRVSASSDDAEEHPQGEVDLDSTDLELNKDFNFWQDVGMRFTDLGIPQGATIVNAYIQFQVDEPTSRESSLILRAEDIDNAPTFTTDDFNISNRNTTSAFALWSPPRWYNAGDAGEDQRTSNLKRIVQEVVDRPGWDSGNSMAILVFGQGKRVAESFDGDPGAAPLLHVEYTTEADAVDSIFAELGG